MAAKKKAKAKKAVKAKKTCKKDEHVCTCESTVGNIKQVGSKVNPYLPQELTILDVQQFAPDTFLFRLKTDMNPMPGQFVEVSVPKTGECPISVASHSDKYLDLLVKNVGTVTAKICALKKGDKMLVRGPYGNGYPMHHFKGNNMVIVGGGTGAAPVRGVIQYLEKHRKDYKDVFLFFGFRSPQDVLFRKDIDAWMNKFNTCLTVDKGDGNWVGKCGVVTKHLEESQLNNDNKIVITCGPPIMIKFAMQSLDKMRFNDDQIYVSMERHMKCGLQKCGHCMVRGKYACRDGPVFRYDQVKGYTSD